MLVLSRYRDEEIVIDLSQITTVELEELRKTPITVKVVDIRGDKVRLGTTAPKIIAVHRREVYNNIQPATTAIKNSDRAVKFSRTE